MGMTQPYDDAPDDANEIDPNWLDKDWLSQQPKETLTELILQLATRMQAHDTKGTLQIANVVPSIPFKELADTAELLKSQDFSFVSLPPNPPAGKPVYAWKLILVSANPQYDPLALIIQGDVTVGRKTGGSNPLLDLTPQGGEMLGVSREHAMLRPSADELLVFDLDSTNGTYCNETIIHMGKPLPVKNNDVLTFGKLHFKVRILERPTTPG